MNDLLFEYKVICNGKEIKLYSTTDIEEFLVRNGYTKYVRDMTDTFENRLLREIKDYKTRNDKAIEYMQEALECGYHGSDLTFDKLVKNTTDILKGSDKE